MRQACQGLDEELLIPPPVRSSLVQSRFPGFQSRQSHFLSKLSSVFHEGQLKRVPSEATPFLPVILSLASLSLPSCHESSLW